MTNKEKKICTTTQTACGSSDRRTFFSGWKIPGTCGKTEPFASQLLRTMQYSGGRAFGRRIQCNGIYRPGSFYERTKGHESDPEGGARCLLCFRQRLEKTAETASLSGYEIFGTTLSVSPHKNYKAISEIGCQLALQYGLSFLDRDFKKKNGFGRSVELSKKYDLYRQDYCGCEYSKR